MNYSPQPNHKTVRVARSEVDIDVKLAPLIPLLWRLGIDTCQCCQEARPGEASIEFPTTGDAAFFLTVARQDYSVETEQWDEGAEDDPCWVVRLIVFFPTQDIPQLVKRCQEDLRL